MDRNRIADGSDGARPRLSLAVGACVAVAAAIWAYSGVLSIWFTGVDTFPHILSARIDSLLEIPGLLGRQYLAAYAGEEVAGSVGVRPVGNLLFALDHALWGLDPSGYHRTALALHALNSALVLWLCRSLGFRRWRAVGVLASVLFAVHPVQSSMLPLIPGRYDLLLGTFSLLFLVGLVHHLEDGGTRSLLFTIAALVLALGANERGVVLWLLVAATLLVRYPRADRRERVATIRLLGWVTVAAGVFAAYRWWFVEGLGGYPLTGTAGPMALPLVGRAFLQDVVLPLPLSFEGTAASAAAYAGGTLLIVGLAGLVWSGVRPAPRRGGPAAAPGEEGRSVRPLEPLVLLAAWCLALLLFYALTFGLTGILKSNYFYVPSALWCALLAGGTVLLLERLAGRGRETTGAGRSPRFAAVGAALGTCLALPVLLGVGRQAQLDRWESGGELARRYLTSMRSALAPVASGSSVLLANVPLGVECTDPPCFGTVYVLDDYSVDAWFRLTAPGDRYEFTALSAVWVDGLPSGDAVSEARFDENEDRLEIRTSGVRVVAPWTPGSRASVDHDLRTGADGGTLRVAPREPSSDVFLYDLFQPGRVLAVHGPDGGPTRAD